MTRNASLLKAKLEANMLNAAPALESDPETSLDVYRADRFLGTVHCNEQEPLPYFVVVAASTGANNFRRSTADRVVVEFIAMAR